MARKPDVDVVVKEGRRERKRRQTRERIESVALKLFLQRGFDATTIEDIAEAADVSKRSFFDYFPSKEEVVAAWQDSFANELIRAVAAQPKNASIVEVIEAAVNSAFRDAIADPQNLALATLIRNTPALCARDQLKYAKLERKLADALCARSSGSDEEHIRLSMLAAAVVTMLRIGGERWTGGQQDMSLDQFARAMFEELWTGLTDLGEQVQRRAPMA